MRRKISSLALMALVVVSLGLGATAVQAAWGWDDEDGQGPTCWTETYVDESGWAWEFTYCN